MYTKLPQQRILDNIRRAITEAKDYRQTLPANTTLPLLPDPDIVMDHLTFIVSNTYLGNDQANLRQQTIGLPMGTNSAPEIANLYLYADESSFIDHLLSRNDIQTARKYATTKRYIDDFLLWDLSPPPISTYGLEYSETTEPDGTVTFLGAQINTLSNGYISLAIYDKTSSWNFPVIRYTHGLSNVPSHQATGIVFSQLTRYRLICNSITNFKKATTSLVKKLLERDHPPSIILRGWERYLIKYSMHDDNERNIALRVWFRKMIKWASYHTINPLQKRLQPSITTTLPPIADNLLPVMGDNIPELFYQSSNNPPQLPSSPPTANKLSSVVGDNLPFDDTISMYNPSQVSVSPTTNHTPPRSYADILRDSSTISTTAPRSNDIPIKQQSLSHLSHSITAPIKTSRTFSSSFANTLHTSPVSTKTLSTNDIPIIREVSKDYSVLLSLDTDATKETFFINLQPIIKRLVEQKASKEDILTSVTTFLKELVLPTIGFSIKDQPKSFQSRYYATNPNGACGYILAYQLYTRRKPCSNTPLDLYNSTTRSQFV
jgi:hypothetical protein